MRIVELGDYYIVDNYSPADEVVLGNYKSKERAIEVLDEIQSVIDCSYQIVSDENGIIEMKKNNIKAFQMPEE